MVDWDSQFRKAVAASSPWWCRLHVALSVPSWGFWTGFSVLLACSCLFLQLDFQLFCQSYDHSHFLQMKYLFYLSQLAWVSTACNSGLADTYIMQGMIAGAASISCEAGKSPGIAHLSTDTWRAIVCKRNRLLLCGFRRQCWAHKESFRENYLNSTQDRSFRASPPEHGAEGWSELAPVTV